MVPGRLPSIGRKNAKASGYQIKYITGTTTKTVIIKGSSKRKATISKLKKRKTYKVSLRSYKTVSGKKYYSAYTTAKKIRIKK